MRKDEVCMYLMMIILWGIALIILITNGRSSSNRWLAATAFIGGFTGFGSLIKDILLPYIFIGYIHNAEGLVRFESITRIILSVSCYFFYPYLMFSLNYCKIKPFNRLWLKIIITLLLFIPIPILYFIYPLDSSYKPETILSVILNAGYITVANIFLFISYFKEVLPKQKRERLLLVLMLIPVTTLSTILGRVMQYLGYHDMWKYEIYLFLYLIIIFLYIISKWGFMGMRIAFQDTEFTNTMNTINTGVWTLDHSLKNETLKIAKCIENIKSSGVCDNDELKWNIRIIRNSCDHLLNTTEKVKQRVRQMELCEKNVNLMQMIENALNNINIYIRDKEINVNVSDQCSVTVLCDPPLIEEVFVNIFTNSIEAMESEGILSVQVMDRGDFFILKITDNGAGISGEMISKVFDPFVTTKNPGTNYGLGLSYCYNVLSKHKWNIEIESKLHKGTTVYITIPKKKELIKAV